MDESHSDQAHHHAPNTVTEALENLQRATEEGEDA